MQSARHGRRSWSRWPITQRTVRPDLVVRLPPILDKHLRFSQRVEDLTVEQFVPELPVEALVVPVLPRAAGLNE